MADGNWKLRYAHCMWKVPVTVAGFGKVNYPSICPLPPKEAILSVKHIVKRHRLWGMELG